MLISIIFSIILIWVMFKTLDRYDYKSNVFIYFIITLIANVLQNGFSAIIGAAITSIITALIMVYLYNKAFDRCNGSFWKFFGWCLLYEIVLIIITVVITSVLAAVISGFAYNGILESAKSASLLMGQ